MAGLCARGSAAAALRQLHQEMREEYGAVRLWRRPGDAGFGVDVIGWRKVGKLEAYRVWVGGFTHVPPPACWLYVAGCSWTSTRVGSLAGQCEKSWVNS